MNNQEPYLELLQQLRQLARLESVAGLVFWDEEVNLPPNRAPWRAEQNAAMAKVIHQAAGNRKLGQLIDSLEKRDDLDDAQSFVVREARRDYERITKLPETYVTRRAEVTSNAYHAWNRARQDDDFNSFAPFIERHLELAHEEANYLGFSEQPYDYWIDRHDPGITAKTITQLFTELRQSLVPLVKEIIDSTPPQYKSIFTGFPISQQNEFLQRVITQMGFDKSRGRIDISIHPFCSGTTFDTRMTTRFDEDKPLDSLLSAVHETGHALYQQGLPSAHPGSALNEAAGMAVHESQSRLWENQVGRSHAFWQYWEPQFRELFPQQLKNVTSEQLFTAINAVKLHPIRTESDEVTYNLHIILRFEICYMLILNSSHFLESF